MPVVTRRPVNTKEMREVSPTRGSDRFGEVPKVFPSAKAAVLWVARRLSQPFTGRDVDSGLNAIDYPHKNHTVHSSLHALKLTGEIRDVSGTDPRQYYVNDPDMKLLDYRVEDTTPAPAPAPVQPTKGPLPHTNGVQAQAAEAAPATIDQAVTLEESTPVDTRQAPPEPTTHLLMEAIEQLIVKIAEIQQPQQPQITLHVDLGEAARTKIAALEEEIRTWMDEVARLESQLSLMTQQRDEIQAVAVALQNRLDMIRHSVGLGEMGE